MASEILYTKYYVAHVQYEVFIVVYSWDTNCLKSAEFRAETNQPYNILNYDKETIAHCLLQTVLVLMIYPQKKNYWTAAHSRQIYLHPNAHKRFVADHIQY
jgi:hypothetical protein